MKYHNETTTCHQNANKKEHQKPSQNTLSGRTLSGRVQSPGLKEKKSISRIFKSYHIQLSQILRHSPFDTILYIPKAGLELPR